VPAGQLLTVRELAERLNVSRATILRYWERGELPGYRVFGAVRFDPDEIADWLEGRHQVPGRPAREGRLRERPGSAGTLRAVADPDKEDRHGRP
jgi:excisionase family DNA binding protein